MLKKLPLCFIFIFCLTTILYSGTTGKIAGLATDQENGEPLAGMNVVIEGISLGAATDVEGEYYIINIPPGEYSVTASMIGYESVTVTNVRVVPDLTTKLNFNLKPEILAGDLITVVAQRPLIQRDITFSGTTTSAEEIENLPFYTISEVMSLSAGLIVTGEGSADGTEEVHIRGGRSNEIVYMVDGFYVKDPHSGGLASDVPTSGIQDLSIITGTFNAEYGEAMSGVVNIVTREGTPEYSGMVSVGTDQLGIDRYNNNSFRTDFNLSGPIPLLRTNGNFFISADYYDTDTYLHESKSFVHDINGNPITRVHHPLTMDRRERYTGKIVIRPFQNIKTVFGYNRLNQKQRLYNVLFKEIPDHNGFDYNESDLYHFTLTHTLTPRTFYNLKVSWFNYNYKHALTDDINSIVRPVVVGDAFGGTSNYEFYGDYFSHIDEYGDSVFVTSDDDFWQKYKSEEFALMGDISSQIHKNHLVKAGFEYKSYKLTENRLDNVNDGGPGVHFEETHYTMKPFKLSAFIQDKMEFDQFVLNAGLRLDYLDHKSTYSPDLTKPDPALRQKVDPKYKLSPRIGFGHPLTEDIRLHFAYGHFYQFPDFNMLYRRMNEYDPTGIINVTVGYRPRIGNPNLKPQTTIAYEFGTEMVLSREVVADITVFYKDIYDYITAKFFDVDPRPYFTTVNMDYANSKGIEFKLTKRFSNHFSAVLNYTYSHAEGNADDWMTHFNEYQNASVTGQIPPKRTVTLDWDQPHTFNFQLDFRWVDDWGINIIGSFGSGLPYTPTDARGKNIGEVNSERKPWTGTVDLRLNKDFHFFGLKERLYLNVWNLFDKKNVYQVFTSSGKADYSANPNDSEELLHNPDWYGPPRRIELGAQISF